MKWCEMASTSAETVMNIERRCKPDAENVRHDRRYDATGA
jgi:hypothetical protein